MSDFKGAIVYTQKNDSCNLRIALLYSAPTRLCMLCVLLDDYISIWQNPICLLSLAVKIQQRLFELPFHINELKNTYSIFFIYILICVCRFLDH